MSWTVEQVEVATSLWRRGFSAAQVARALPGPTTHSRNAVLGKLFRLGASRSPDAAKEAQRLAHVNRKQALQRERDARPRVVKAPAAKPNVEGRPHVDRVEPAGRATLSTLALTGECKWPIGDPRDATFSFCGAAAHGTYCAEHAVRARAPTAKHSSSPAIAERLQRHDIRTRWA